MQPEELSDNCRWQSDRPRIRRLFWYRAALCERAGFTMRQATLELEVSERTIYRDLNYLQTLGWGVDYCHQRQLWRIDSTSRPRLPLISLTEEEGAALLAAEGALRRFAGAPFMSSIDSALKKLQDLLTDSVITHVRSGIPGFDGPPARCVDNQQFQILTQACREQRRLRLLYYTPSRDADTERLIDPYRLFSWAGDWYVAAYDHYRGQIRTFALGPRMRNLTETDEQFERDPEWDPDAYAASAFGLFHGGAMELLELHFAPIVAPYIREKVWSESETKEELPDGSLILRFKAPINIGVLRWVLAWGADVEVRAPVTLQLQVCDHARRMLKVAETSHD